MQTIKKIALTNTVRTESTYVVRPYPLLSRPPVVIKKLNSFLESENFVLAASATSALLFQIALDAGYKVIAIALATIFIIGSIIIALKTIKHYKTL